MGSKVFIRVCSVSRQNCTNRHARPLALETLEYLFQTEDNPSAVLVPPMWPEDVILQLPMRLSRSDLPERPQIFPETIINPSCTLCVMVNRRSTEKDLTRACIRALAASLYEPRPRFWFEGQWQCPQCHRLNRQNIVECACGITRDGLPEFCERY